MSGKRGSRELYCDYRCRMYWEEKAMRQYLKGEYYLKTFRK